MKTRLDRDHSTAGLDARTILVEMHVEQEEENAGRNSRGGCSCRANYKATAGGAATSGRLLVCSGCSGSTVEKQSISEPAEFDCTYA